MQYILGVSTQAGVMLFAGLGMALLTGFTGMFSMGHAAFMAIGGYTCALLLLFAGFPFVIALIVGGIAGALAGYLIGVVTLKNQMRGDHFAIAMMGFGTAVVLILNNVKRVINGAMGLSGIPRLTDIWTVLIFDAVGIWLLRNYVRSQWGRNCVAIREQEVAAEMMGVDVYKTKLLSMTISAFFCGVAGGLYGCYVTYLQPAMFAQERSSDLLASVVLGGMHSITGPVIASFLLVFVPEFLRGLSKWRLVVYGIMFVLIMAFRPQGLMGFWELSPKRLLQTLKRRTQSGLGRRGVDAKQ